MGFESLKAVQFKDLVSITSPDLENIRYLPVNLGGMDVQLEMKNVKDPTKDGPDIWIAYYDPRKDDLREAGINVLVPRLEYLNADVIVTASSDKSTQLLQETHIKLSQKTGKPIDLIVLKRRDPNDAEMVAERKKSIFSTRYKPITAKGEEREMILTQNDLERLAIHIKEEKRIVIVDDVYSSGETTQAITYLLNQCRAGLGVIYPKETLYDIVTVMRECEREPNYDLIMPHVPNLLTGIITPVIIGDLPAQSVN